MANLHRFFLGVLLLSTSTPAFSYVFRANEEDEQGTSRRVLQPFYHTTGEIKQKLNELSGACDGMLQISERSDTDNATGEAVSIDVVSVKKAAQQGGPSKNKFFLLFGEHARELISPESALHFLSSLCDPQNEKARKALETTEFQVIVNGNPRSRAKVEQGDFCLRVNPNGVDLNRNWNEKWLPLGKNPSFVDTADTNPGESAFSEPETRIFKAVIEEFQPTSFLTIHSGTKGMYMPWAYDMEHLADRNEASMMQILQKLDKEYCQCPFGAAGREVGYSCPGTCLDYVYDKMKTSYAFAVEIYTDPMLWPDLEDRYHEKLRSMQSDFFQLQKKNEPMSPAADQCFLQYNPSDEAAYKQTVESWTNVYLDMAQEISGRL